MTHEQESNSSTSLRSRLDEDDVLVAVNERNEIRLAHFSSRAANVREALGVNLAEDAALLSDGCTANRNNSKNRIHVRSTPSQSATISTSG
jgi:hypothetical protein